MAFQSISIARKGRQAPDARLKTFIWNPVMSAKPFGPPVRQPGAASSQRVRVASACAPNGGWTIHVLRRLDATSRPDR